MHAGCQSGSTGLSETILFTWELCKLKWRLWVDNKRALLMLLPFCFQGSSFSGIVFTLKIPHWFNFKTWNVQCALLNEAKCS